MAAEMRQEWAWRDIFRSIGLAFSFTRLMIGLFGVAFLAVADSLVVWGIGSADTAGAGPWLMRAMVAARWIVACYVFLFTATAIAHSAKGELLDGEGAGIGESIAFVFKKFGSIFWTPVLFWVFVGVMGGLAFLFFMLPALIARLAGWTLLVSLCWYALTFLFTTLLAVLGALGILAFLFSLFLAPPIIATRQEGALDATLDSIDLMRGKGAFWVAILVLAAAGFVGAGILGKTMDVTYRVSNIVIGEDFRKTVVGMPKELRPRPGTVVEAASMYWPGEYCSTMAWLAKKRGRVVKMRPRGLEIGLTVSRASVGDPASLSTRYKVAGWMLGIWVLIVAGLLVSYVAGAVVSAATLTYLIVREEDEFLEPAAVEVPPPSEKPAEGKAEKDEKEGEEEAETEEAEKPEKAKSDKSSKRSKRKKKG